jgi:hypothetical protein
VHNSFDLGGAIRTKTHSPIYSVWPEHKGPRLPAGFDAAKESAAGRFDARAVGSVKLMGNVKFIQEATGAEAAPFFSIPGVRPQVQLGPQLLF